jgi:CsoR family transcriptional regulator, copper-sensing transcriptional repressor
MEPGPPEVTAEMIARLRRIEGQVRGVQRMIETGRECPDVLQQMAAIRSAVQHASLVLARAYVASCIRQPATEDAEVTLDRLMSALGRLD